MRIIILKIIIVFLGIGLFLFFLFMWLVSPLPCNEKNICFDKSHLIAHAAGSVDGCNYLNCKEGLFSSLKKGYKYIEVDLGMTTDSSLVCIHDWRHFHKLTTFDSIISQEPISEKEFLKRKILGKYTPLTLTDVIRARNSFPFIIITDKVSDPQLLNSYFLGNRQTTMVEAFSLDDYVELKKSGYIPMMSEYTFSYSQIFWLFIYLPLKHNIKIDWVCIHSSSNMKSLRILKRLFNCKVAMYGKYNSSFLKEHLGKEIDLIYVDE